MDFENKKEKGYKLILKNIVSLSFYDKLQRNEQSLRKKKNIIKTTHENFQYMNEIKIEYVFPGETEEKAERIFKPVRPTPPRRHPIIHPTLKPDSLYPLTVWEFHLKTGKCSCRCRKRPILEERHRYSKGRGEWNERKSRSFPPRTGGRWKGTGKRDIRRI